MFAEKDGRCIDCQCGCHEKARKSLETISGNLREFGVKALQIAFWAFVVFCLFGGMNR